MLDLKHGTRDKWDLSLPTLGLWTPPHYSKVLVKCTSLDCVCIKYSGCRPKSQLTNGVHSYALVFIRVNRSLLCLLLCSFNTWLPSCDMLLQFSDIIKSMILKSFLY